jgi:peptide/nickel transport system substrate-binding protein
VDYIDTIEAADAKTVVIKAKLNDAGKAVNPLAVAAYVSSNYVFRRPGPRRWKSVSKRMRLRCWPIPPRMSSTPALITILRGRYEGRSRPDDKYWGQDASMWGKLPAPKYLAHTIFKDNAAVRWRWPRAKWTSASS